MIQIPSSVFIRYQKFLERNEVDSAQYANYKKWLRYYLDFCAKYIITDDKSERVRQFLDKLREKGQSEEKRKQAAHAIAIYFEQQKLSESDKSTDTLRQDNEQGAGMIK